MGASKLRRNIWLGVNVAAMVAVLCLSAPLWKLHWKAGEYRATGPGGGLYFFFLVIIPWCLFGLINLFVLVFRLFKPGISFRSGLLSAELLGTAVWVALAFFIWWATRIPEGVIYLGS